jgi:AcrR family transcriptional regulator
MARPRSDIQERIVEAARGRFLREGVDGASVRSIADDAGTSVGMISYYFAGKDDLFLAVVEAPYGRLLDELERALSPGVEVRERLRRLFHRVAALSPEELETGRLVLREALTSTSRLQRLVERFLRGHIPLLLGIVSDGVREGTLSRERPPLLLMMAILALAGPPQVIARQLRGHLPGHGLPPAEALADALLEILLGGAAGPSARPPRVRTRRKKP